MTAQLLEYTSSSDRRVRRLRAARAADVRALVTPHREAARTRMTWGAPVAHACEIARPVPASAPRSVAARPAAGPAGSPVAPTRLVWTPRGVAVMVGTVAAVTAVMVTTVVGAFLSVSNAPLVALIGG